MSTAAREEAIDIVQRRIEAQWETMGVTDLSASALAIGIVNKLEETHTISRRTPRVHRPSDDSHPQSQIRRIMAGRD